MSHTYWAKRRAALFGAAAVGLMSASAARAATISVDWFGGGGSAASSVMAPSEVAGVVPVANWNSLTPNTQATPVALVDSAGAATTATVAWASQNTWNTPNVPPVAPGDLNMMKGYLDSNDNTAATGNTTTVTLSGLTAAMGAGPYSLIVYYDGENGAADRTGRYSVSGATTGNAAVFARDGANQTFGGTYVPGFSPVDPLVAVGGGVDNNGAAATSVPAGNFLFFTGLSGDSLTLSALSYVASDGTNRAPINGIQLVSGTVPEPTGLAAVALAGLALGRRARRRA